jgi:hypothetical protein
VCTELPLELEEYERKKTWLKHSSEPWPEVLKLWAETSFSRRQEIRASTDKGVAEVFKEWPRFKDAIGYIAWLHGMHTFYSEFVITENTYIVLQKSPVPVSKHLMTFKVIK